MGNNYVNHISFQIQYPVDTTEHKEIIPMHTFLCQLKRRWIEKTVYTRANKPFSVSVSEIPHLLPLVYQVLNRSTPKLKRKVFT